MAIKPIILDYAETNRRLNVVAVLLAPPLLLISIRSQSYHATFVIPLMVAKRTPSRSPVDGKRLVGRPRRIGAKQASARSGQWNLGPCLLCKQVQGWCDWNHLSPIQFP
jgi:hypothetical protein